MTTWKREGGYFYKEIDGTLEFIGQVQASDECLDFMINSINFVEAHPDRNKIIALFKRIDQETLVDQDRNLELEFHRQYITKKRRENRDEN